MPSINSRRVRIVSPRIIPLEYPEYPDPMMMMMPTMNLPQPTMRSGPEMLINTPPNISSHVDRYVRQNSNHFEVFPISEPLTDNSLSNQPFQVNQPIPSGLPLFNPNIHMPYDDFYLYPNELHPSFQQPEPLPLRPSELQPTTTPGWHNSFSNVEVPPSMRRPSDASPIEYDFCAGDPLNPKKDYQEKRERSQSELDQQKEEIRQLKEYGGACDRCYKSKKKCGPSSPCPPCRANKRKCVRRGSSISGHKDTHSSDADISSSPSVEPPVETQVIEETLDTMQPGPWEPQLIPSIDGTYCDDDAGCSQESKG